MSLKGVDSRDLKLKKSTIDSDNSSPAAMPDHRTKRQKVEDDAEPHWQDNNSDGPSHFSKLPTELVYEIVTDINNSGDSQAVAVLTQPQPEDFDASNGRQDEDVRQATLRALSQTSRMLRAICLPLLWERVVFPHESPNKFRMTVDSDGCEVLLSRFDRIMDGLVENPTLAAYVRRLDVYIQILSWHPSSIIIRLKDCLSVLLGVHTLRLESDIPWFHFPRESFPQIRTLRIPSHFARFLIPSFPNVRAVICQGAQNMRGDRSMLGAFHNCRDTLEVIEGFPLDPENAEYLAQTTHNLRVIKFLDWVSPESLMLLKPLTRLHMIEMEVNQPHTPFEKPKSAKQLDSWMDAAKEALAGHDGWNGQNHGGKRVKMAYRVLDYMGFIDLRFQYPAINETFLNAEVD